MGRNWDWSRQRGKERRLEAEQTAFHGGEQVPACPPLHSHDATMQSQFEKGWNSVTQCQINIHIGKAKSPQLKPGDAIANLGRLKQCHFH